MTEKIILDPSNKALLACSKCFRQKEVDMTQFLVISHTSGIKIKCKCGHRWSIDLEQRRHVRKTTNLPGDYVVYEGERPVDTGHMRVVDLSKRGMRLKLDRKREFKIGDRLEVEFRLDNKSRTFIIRMVEVRNIVYPHIGVQFIKTDRLDPDIGYYLMEK